PGDPRDRPDHLRQPGSGGAGGGDPAGRAPHDAGPAADPAHGAAGAAGGLGALGPPPPLSPHAFPLRSDDKSRHWRYSAVMGTREAGLPGRWFRLAEWVSRDYRDCHAAGWSSSVARRAHNPKVAGSNPAPATNLSTWSEALFDSSRRASSIPRVPELLHFFYT